MRVRSPLPLVLAALLVLGLLAPATAAPAPTAAAAGGDDVVGDDVALDLEGTWRFSRGDDMAWADPAFDDSAWGTQQVPDTSLNQGFDNYDGYAWFRRSFTLPAEAEGVNLIGAMGFIDDADEIYLNGVLIGASGSVDAPRRSAWFERRAYGIPADAPIFGGENVIAVRMYDMSGGGGWYKGPIGLFSKSRLRAEVFGITAPPAPADVREAVLAVLDAQAAALDAGDLDAYLATLDPGFSHDGQDVERRGRELARHLADADAVRFADSEVEVLLDGDEVIVDTNRRLETVAEEGVTVLRPTRQEFLRFDADTLLEVGNRSRFFRDVLYSEVEGKPREFNVYLPPSYFDEPDRSFPTVYLLHGINGGNREWEPREIDRLIDAAIAEHDLVEPIVVMPHGASLWYRDDATVPWRTMFITELVPLVDAEYRTIPEPGQRGLTGVSMGGNGAFSIGWDHPELFRSIGSHIGALTLGGNGQSAASYPAVRATSLTSEFLGQYAYFFDSCPADDFGFAAGVVAMRAQLTAKLVPHTGIIYPGTGRHNDDCWLPNLWRSFAVHSASFTANGR
jgi:enterochelin esterase-like enzyme